MVSTKCISFCTTVKSKDYKSNHPKSGTVQNMMEDLKDETEGTVTKGQNVNILYTTLKNLDFS